MLALALERLSQTNPRPDNLSVNIYADHQTNLEDVEYVRDEYFPTASIFHAHPHIACPQGTWNILEAIKAGYQTGADLVYLVEEDVMVRPNFFQQHQELIQTGEYLAVCGRKEKRLYERCGPLYVNPGSCLTRKLIENVIPHMNPEYYSNPDEYVLKHFPVWSECSILDDGLIRRVVKQMEGVCGYPVEDICAHQGFRFYNRLDIYMNFETTIEKRIERLRQIIQKIKPGDRYAGDFEPL